MLESNIEKTVVEWAGSEGGKALKLKNEERGFPDRTIILPGARIAFPELKRPKKNKRYEQQKRMIAWLQSMGFPAEFCDNLESVKELLR